MCFACRDSDGKHHHCFERHGWRIDDWCKDCFRDWRAFKAHHVRCGMPELMIIQQYEQAAREAAGMESPPAPTVAPLHSQLVLPFGDPPRPATDDDIVSALRQRRAWGFEALQVPSSN